MGNGPVSQGVQHLGIRSALGPGKHDMKHLWRSVGIPASILVVFGVSSCAKDAKVVARAPSVSVRPVSKAAPPAKPAVPFFLIDDEHNTSVKIELGEGRIGTIVSGRRVVRSNDSVRVVGDLEPKVFARAIQVPDHLGGGFLFSSGKYLYASKSFDGTLEPVIGLPETIEGVSFGGKYAIVYTDAGDRIGMDLRTKAIVPITPIGLTEIASVSDGRVGVLMSGGRAMFSLDKGEHFSDITSRFQVAAVGVKSVGQTLVFEDGASREIHVDSVEDRAVVVGKVEVADLDQAIGRHGGSKNLKSPRF